MFAMLKLKWTASANILFWYSVENGSASFQLVGKSWRSLKSMKLEQQMILARVHALSLAIWRWIANSTYRNLDLKTWIMVCERFGST